MHRGSLSVLTAAFLVGQRQHPREKEPELIEPPKPKPKITGESGKVIAVDDPYVQRYEHKTVGLRRYEPPKQEQGSRERERRLKQMRRLEERKAKKV